MTITERIQNHEGEIVLSMYVNVNADRNVPATVVTSKEEALRLAEYFTLGVGTAVILDTTGNTLRLII